MTSCAARSLYAGPVKVDLTRYTVWVPTPTGWRRARSWKDLPVDPTEVTIAPRGPWRPATGATPANVLTVTASRDTAHGRAGRAGQFGLGDLARHPDLLAVACGVGPAYARLVLSPRVNDPYALLNVSESIIDEHLLAARLWELATTDDDRETLAAAHSCPRPFLERCLAEHLSPRLLATAAAHHKLRGTDVAHLVTHPDPAVRTAVLERNDANPVLLLLAATDPDLAPVVASHPNTPPVVLTALARTTNAPFVVANPSCPTEVFAALAPVHRTSAVTNPNASPALLEETYRIMKTGDQLQGLMAAALVLSHPNCPSTVFEDVATYPAGSLHRSLAATHCPPELCHLFFHTEGDIDWDCAADIGRRADCPEVLQSELANDPNPSVRASVAAATRHSSLAEALLTDPAWAVRVDAAANPALSRDAIARVVARTDLDDAVIVGLCVNPTVRPAERLALIANASTPARLRLAANSQHLPPDVAEALFGPRAAANLEPGAVARVLDAAGLDSVTLDTAVALLDGWSGTVEELIVASRALQR